MSDDDTWWTANTCSNSTVSLPRAIASQFYSIIYAIPMTLLYFMVIVATKRQLGYFSVVYTRLFTLCCIMNVVCWWLEFFFSLIIGFDPLCPLWITFSRQYWLSILYFCYACCPLANFTCTMAVSIYQMAGIVFPTYSEQTFKNRAAIMYLVIFLIPIIVCLHVLYSVIIIVPLTHSRVYMMVLHFSSSLNFLTLSLVNFIVGAISLVIIFCCCLISILRYSRMGQHSSSSVKLRLFIINLYICLSTAIFIFYQILIYFSNLFESDYSVLELIYSYRTTLADICYLPLPIFILLINKRLRKYFWHNFLGKKDDTVVTAWGSSHNRVSPSAHMTSVT